MKIWWIFQIFYRKSFLETKEGGGEEERSQDAAKMKKDHKSGKLDRDLDWWELEIVKWDMRTIPLEIFFALLPPKFEFVLIFLLWNWESEPSWEL